MNASLEWMAGYLDAKATITRHHDPRRGGSGWQVQVYCVDSNPAGLQLLVSTFGGNLEQRNGGSAQRWMVRGKWAEECLEQVLPFLVLKQTRAREVLETPPSLIEPLIRGVL